MSEWEDNVLDIIRKSGGFTACSPPTSETKEEKEARKRFEQHYLKSSKPVLRDVANRLGIEPKVIVAADELGGECLSQLVIHAYRKGIRLSENIDVVYQDNGEKMDKKELEKDLEDIWGESDSTENTGTKKKSEKDTTTSDKVVQKKEKKQKVTEDTKRPEKDSMEIKLDESLKASLTAMDNSYKALNVVNELNHRLEFISTNTIRIQEDVENNKAVMDILVKGTIRTMQLVSHISKEILRHHGGSQESIKEFMKNVTEETTSIEERFRDRVRKTLEDWKERNGR